MPSDHSRCLHFTLPDYWTPAQALAVVELLDDLRERIYGHYLTPIQTMLRDDLATEPTKRNATNADEPPF